MGRDNSTIEINFPTLKPIFVKMAAFAMSSSMPALLSRPAVAGRARAQAKSTRSVRVMASAGSDYVKTLPGITEFPGFFDPFGLSEKATPAEIKRWREAEVTHGRVSMLAALGFIIGEQGDGGFPLFDGEVTGPAINQFQQVPPYFWLPLVMVIGIAESFRVGAGWASPDSANFYKLKDDYVPGDLGFDPLGLCPEDSEELAIMQTKELNNGRLAMLAIALFVIQEVADKGEVEIFEHWFSNAESFVEVELELELETVEKEAGVL